MPKKQILLQCGDPRCGIEWNQLIMDKFPDHDFRMAVAGGPMQLNMPDQADSMFKQLSIAMAVLGVTDRSEVRFDVVVHQDCKAYDHVYRSSCGGSVERNFLARDARVCGNVLRDWFHGVEVNEHSLFFIGGEPTLTSLAAELQIRSAV